MKVIVDTDVWSEAFRKRKGTPSTHVRELTDLVQEGRIELIGPIRMEILSGIRDPGQFDQFEQRLAAFPDRPIPQDCYVLAARFFNQCRSKGIQGSNTDFLICACAVSWELPLLTKDKDYNNYSKHLPIDLLKPRKR